MVFVKTKIKTKIKSIKRERYVNKKAEEAEQIILTYQFRDLTINDNSYVFRNFLKIKGMGWHKIEFALSNFGISPKYTFLGCLIPSAWGVFFNLLEHYVMSPENIDRFPNLQIKTLIELETYKGSRHLLALPVHGQRTRTNANTQRSKRHLTSELARIAMEAITRKNNEKNNEKNK